MLFTSQGRSVLGKTVPYEAGIQVLGHIFSQFSPPSLAVSKKSILIVPSLYSVGVDWPSPPTSVPPKNHDVWCTPSPKSSKLPPLQPQSVKKNWFFWKLLVIIRAKAKLYTNRIPEHKRGRGTKQYKRWTKLTIIFVLKGSAPHLSSLSLLLMFLWLWMLLQLSMISLLP